MGRLLKASLSLWVWLLLLNAIAGVLRGVMLAPIMGEVSARWTATAGEVLVLLLLISLFFHRLANGLTWFRLVVVSLLWVGLTLVVDLLYAHYVLGVAMETLTGRYHPMQGPADSFRLLVLALSPFILGGQWVRRDKAAEGLIEAGPGIPETGSSDTDEPANFVLPDAEGTQAAEEEGKETTHAKPGNTLK